jgi:hypothetical protein
LISLPPWLVIQLNVKEAWLGGHCGDDDFTKNENYTILEVDVYGMKVSIRLLD